MRRAQPQQKKAAPSILGSSSSFLPGNSFNSGASDRALLRRQIAAELASSTAAYCSPERPPSVIKLDSRRKSQSYETKFYEKRLSSHFRWPKVLCFISAVHPSLPRCVSLKISP